MKKLLWLLLLAPAFAQNVRVDNVALGPKGPIPFASVAACTQPAVTTTQPCSPLANLCSSLTDLTCTQPNPVTADALGNYHFYVKQAQLPVTVQLFGPQVASPLVLTDQSFGNNATSTNTFTGTNTFTNVNNTFHVGGNTGLTLAQGVASCPGSGTAGCHIVIDGPLTFTAPITYSVTNSPLIIDCVLGSGVNQNPQGLLLTYAPAAWSNAAEAAINITTNTRFQFNNCNLTQGNAIDGPVTPLTNVVGNGTSATGNCSGTCTYAVGQVVFISGNANAGFNKPFTVTAVGANTFTFASTVNATGAGGNAQTGFVGILTTGVQNASYINSQVYNFTNMQLQIEDSGSSSGEYNNCLGSQFRGGRLAVGLNGFLPKSVSANTFTSCVISSASVMQLLTTGTASENSFTGGEISDTAGTNPVLVQLGDGINACRENNFYNVTMETPNTSPANQIGVDNRCQGMVAFFEGALTGTTPTIILDNGPTGTGHFLVKAGAFAPTGCPLTPYSESTIQNLRWDCNGNIGLGASAPIAGTNPAINGAGGLALCNAGGCPAQVLSSGLQILTTLRVTNLLASATAPTIAAGGCGGAAASIAVNNGTAAFKVNVGTAPGSTCTITMPTATTGWNCTANDITTQSTSVFVQKQTGAESTTSVVITNFNDVAVASAFTASDILKVTCAAD